MYFEYIIIGVYYQSIIIYKKLICTPIMHIKIYQLHDLAYNFL